MWSEDKSRNVISTNMNCIVGSESKIRKEQKVTMLYGDRFYYGIVVATEYSSVSSSDDEDNIPLMLKNEE